MSFLFGRRKTAQEQVTECKRTIDRSRRALEREQVKLENEKAKLTVNIKKAANQGQMDSVRIYAKQIARTENHIKKFRIMRPNLMVCLFLIHFSLFH